MSNISAVLPFTQGERHKSNSLKLLDVLFFSLERFADPGLFESFNIITRPEEVNVVRSHVDRHGFLNIKVWNELDVAPEIKSISLNGSWWLQQVLKLAACQFITTPYYVTFDPDVFCTKPVKEEDLLQDGKGLLQLTPKSNHKNWWSSSAFQLDMKPSVKGEGIHVTPVVMSSEAVRGLIKELSAKETWIRKLLRPHSKNSLLRFLPGFKKRYRWTEYTLYYLYLEKHGLVEKYHIIAERDVRQTLLSRNSVWRRDNFDEWNPDKCFSNEDNALFCIVQSNKKIDPDVILEKIGKYFVKA